MAQPPYPPGGPNAGYPPQPYGAQPGYPPQQGGYPPQQPGYPPQQPGYPPQQGGYPPQQGGYPPQQGGYPPQQGGYPPQQGGYPPQQPGYPPQQPGYPPQQGGYPPQQGGYPPQQGGYPPQQAGYPPQQGGYPPQQGGYPPQQPGYPPQQPAYAAAPAPVSQGYAVAQPAAAPLPNTYQPNAAYSGHGPMGPGNIKDIKAKGANAGMVVLNFSCKGLRDRDVLSKSDPQVILYTSVKDRTNYTITGRTEKVKNNLNPVFGTGVEIPYIFERQTFCKVVVIDDDNEGLSATADNLGEAEFTLGQAVSKKTLELELRHRRWGPKGTINIAASHTTTTKELVTLQLEGGHLDKKDTFGKSDPYYELYRVTGGTEALIKRSEVVYNNLNPRWRQVELTSTQLCNADDTASIKIKVWDFDEAAAPDLIGECVVTLGKMKKCKKEMVEFDLIHPKKQPPSFGDGRKKNYRNSGIIKVLQCVTVKTWSFLDYVSAGLQLNCMVGFDFTASNGHPNTPASLHHLNAQGVNQYTMAWTAVGQILQDYDWDKMFPAYGFGGALPPNNQVSFEFALNANAQDPNCAGIEGVISAYQTALQNVALSGPTNCAPLIRTATRYANTCATTASGGQGYLILLILTDGQFTDTAACLQAIQQAQQCPMSIIIVGVGNADFSNMEYLDGDRTNAAARTRDIVQFVPYNKYAHNKSISATETPSLLARELLAELPGQVEKYFTARKVPPLGKKMH